MPESHHDEPYAEITSGGLASISDADTVSPSVLGPGEIVIIGRRRAQIRAR
ncbi:hypothetical protein DL89DRAFT_269242, partial [Linderina pennispora]